MNNFILNLLGIEDDNVIVDDFFNEKETNTLVVTVSLKRKDEVCPKCGSVCIHIHSHHNHSTSLCHTTDYLDNDFHVCINDIYL